MKGHEKKEDGKKREENKVTATIFISDPGQSKGKVNPQHGLKKKQNGIIIEI
ncbi:MAG: hypothetical protein JSV88_04120 [Candidatus Aminicenantes bacterium]|nr:MAG: hypothetical protein JSV88_04120 [Candidatus Aminicenantes bacterium]